MATSTVNCPICQDELKEPRVLPCIHSFCLQCLKRHCKGRLPGDDVPCPVCRNGFQIPKTGVAGLTRRTHSKEAVPSAMCEACSSEEHRIPATVYCVNCSQKLCERCSIPHLKWKRGPHDVKTLVALSPKRTAGGNFCDKHKERVKIYCHDCQSSVCSMCCLESHKTHRFEQIDIMMKKFAKCIDKEIKPVTQHIESFRGAVAQVEAESSNLFSNMQAIEQEIKKKGAEIKRSLPQLIDRQVGELLHKLWNLKSTAEEEVKEQVDAVQLGLTELESFRTSSLDLKSTVSPGDIKQTTSDVRDTAKGLLQRHVIPSEYHAPSYLFMPTPVNIDEMLKDKQNIIGHVAKVADPVDVLRTESCTSLPAVVDAQQASGSSEITKHKTSASSFMAPSDTETISTNNVDVRGVTSVDDKLFVLLQRDENQVAIYFINNYKLLSHLNLPGLKAHDRNDLTSCVLHKCFYASDNHNKCIHRYDLASSAISQWKVPSATPKCLSVTPSCNLLVTCHKPNKLVELSAGNGLCVHEIPLQSDIAYPWHSVQLTTGQYVVCHGSWTSLHRVCIVDRGGGIIQSFGDKCGYAVDQLKMPSHMVVDEESQLIFVADCLNDRVILLSSTMKFVCYKRIPRPSRLYLHHATRRLYVGQGSGDCCYSVVDVAYFITDH